MSGTRPYRQYIGQAFYDHMGQFLHEIGDDRPEMAKKRIAEAAKTMEGKWAFAVHKKMHQTSPGAPQVWETFLVFVDGKARKLRQGEKIPSIAVDRCSWIGAKTVESILGQRPGSNVVMNLPSKTARVGKDTLITLRKQRFDNMAAFEKFCNSLPIKKRIFVHEPPEELAPEGDGLVIYLAVEQ